MKLSNNIKPKNGIWKLIPYLANKTGHGIYPNVYLPIHIYKDLKSENPNPWNIGLLLHEQEHIKRQKSEGPVKWILKYIFIPKFRFEEEIIADIPMINYLKSKKLEFDIDRRAKQLSGWLYLWPVSYQTAREKLTNIFKK